MSSRSDAEEIFRAAVTAASAYGAVNASIKLNSKTLRISSLSSIDLKKTKRIFVIGAGKAAPAMALAIEDAIGPLIADGCIVTKYGHGRPLRYIRVIEAGHPVPDSKGLAGSRELLSIAEGSGSGDLVICLLSGGASALLPAPAPGLTLKDEQRTTELLLKSGASINEMNAVRKHLSLIKGGLLARAAYPARVLSLIVSDVVGDDLSAIASGPTAPDPSTYLDAVSILKKYGLASKVPPAVIKRLKDGAKGRLEETPKPGEEIFRRVDNFIVANNSSALEAARAKAESLGYNAIILSSTITGSVREAAGFLSSIALEVKKTGNPVERPACILMGGEPTIKVSGKGKGGRMQEFALESALRLKGEKGITVLAGGTDGTDGPTDAAGALVDSDTISRAGKMGLDAQNFLRSNDSHNFFKKAGGLLVTGPTGTNVMDVMMAILE
ncbi:MAG: glycerate kinase [Deltaproteobacteria bacterium]|nr:glycerate kinase [Deltaproteobacteria bacterium]